MIDHELDYKGLDKWRAEGTAEAVVEWSVNPDQGLVQGPLDLGFLDGKRIALTLRAGQMALVVAQEELQAVYLDGCHVLAVGREDEDLSADSHLVFLDVNNGLDVGWTADEPLAGGAAGDVIGNCTLYIEGPGRFFATFLAGVDDWNEEFILRVVRQATGSALERILKVVATDPMGLQARLANLDPADLDEELAPLGLRCRRAALYTSAPPVESGADAAGQFEGVRHN